MSWRIKSFIEGKLFNDTKVEPLAPRITPMTLQLVYLDRKLRVVEIKLDKYVFIPLGIARKFDKYQKFCLVAGSFMVILGMSLIIFIQ